MAVIEVIKYNGSPDVFAWKHPNEELGTWSQLIVNESQEAVLFKGGQALDVFGPGRHTLETSNIPLLSKFVNLPFGRKSPFAAEVWYINKVHSLNIKWGTPSPIQLQDPKYKVFIPLRSFGQFGMQIGETKKFLVKLVGTLPAFDKDNVTKYFRGLYLTKVKDAISTYLIKKNVSVLEINAYLDELSEHLKELMAPLLDEYGIRLINFYVNDINVPEEDPAVIKLKEALSKRAEMDIVGYNYVQQRSFDTLEGAATNTGSGQAGLMGAGLGLGMGVGMGGAVGGAFGNLAQNINTVPEARPEETTVCSECGFAYSKKHKFCPECGDSYNPCVHCGTDLKKGQSTCSKCGKSAPKPCPKCGAATGSAKFCPECGERLTKVCAGCGVALNGDPKFCPDCGMKLKEE